MSHNIELSTADKSDIVAYIGGTEFTQEQQRLLGIMRDKARLKQEDLDYQEVDWGLTIPEALDHLIAGRADAEGTYVGNAYRTALQIIIDRNASDPTDVGTYSRPSTFFGLMGEELRRLGVPEAMLPHDFLYAGPPSEIPIYIPHSIDGYPEIGHLPLNKAKPVADAYRAVLDRVHNDFAYDLKLLIEKLEFEHEQWVYATKEIDWYTQDTIFFRLG